MRPDRPDHAGKLVGHCDRCLVVDVGLAEVEGPFPETIGLLLAGVEKDRAGPVDEEGPQVPISPLRDPSQVPLETARVLTWSQA